MGLMKEFKEFALKGSVVDMAIGVIIGAAFKDIVTSFTDNFINPIIASLGGADIGGSFVLPWVDTAGLTEEEIAAVSIGWGAFITAIINFLIMALILFFMLKGINALKNGTGKLKKKKAEEAPAPAPEPTEEVKLLTEIKDLLKAQNAK